MTVSPIIESEMSFGPYPAGTCFHIENSRLYTSNSIGVKMAEFLLLCHRKGKPPVIWIVEAKSSSPNTGTKSNEVVDFIDEIKAKIMNAFSMGIAACLHRHQRA